MGSHTSKKSNYIQRKLRPSQSKNQKTNPINSAWFEAWKSIHSMPESLILTP